jgi:hypothetical protein
MPKRYPSIHAAEKQPATIEFIADVEIKAAAGEDGKKGAPEFFSTAYTGGELKLNGFDLPVVVDLKGVTYRKSIIANLDHDKKQRVGHVNRVENDGRTLRLAGVVSGAGPAATEVMQAAEKAFPWQQSIEAKPQQMVMIHAGKKVRVNEQDFEGPIYVARKSQLYGVAFLTNAADDNTSVTIAASAASSKGNDMDPELKKWIEAAGFSDEEYTELTDKQKAGLKSRYDEHIKVAAKTTPAGGDPLEIEAEEFDVDDIRAAHSEHLETIEAKLAVYEDNVPAKKLTEIKASAKKKARELKAAAVKEKWTSTKFETAAIQAAADLEVQLVRAERPTGPAIHAAMRDMSGEVIEAAMCQSLKLPDLEKQYNEKTLEAAHKSFHGRIGLQQVLIMAAAANGYEHAPGERIHQGNLRRVLKFAFLHDADIHAASSLSLSTTFSNIATKELLAGFMEEDQSWREISVVRPVNDFKTMTSFRLNDNFEYEELGQDGKIAHGQVGEETYTRQAKTYAKFWSLTRVDIINDDQGAFNDLRTRLGRGAGRKFNNLFWSRFMAALATFFTSGRGNYISGSTTTLVADGVGLQLAITALDKLQDASGKRIGGTADLLLTPSELQFTAQRLWQSTQVNTGGSNTAESVGNAGIHAGKYRPVKQVRLSDSTFTGYSSTMWFLLRPARELAAMVVSFLNGVETPTVETADAAFDTLGVDFRGFHDFGADTAEFLCGIMSKGAA